MKDEFTYFNDEWNPKLLKFRGSNNLVKHSILMNDFNQSKCYCHLPRPNSFTGNCTICNKIINPIIDENADKHRK